MSGGEFETAELPEPDLLNVKNENGEDEDEDVTGGL